MSIQRRSHLLIPREVADHKALIIGAGTVGSNVAFALAAIGVRDFTIVDFDEVDTHNLPSQAFSESQIGVNKALALADNLEARYKSDGINVEPIPDKFAPDFERQPYSLIISGADSMRVRKMASFWARSLNARLIDSRCAGHEVQTWAYDTADTDQFKAYQATLYADSEASSLPCGGEMYPAAGLAASVATLAAVSTKGYFYRMSDTQTASMFGA